MEFGVQFFPDVAPEQKSAAEYFADALILAEEADNLGFTRGDHQPDPLHAGRLRRL